MTDRDMEFIALWEQYSDEDSDEDSDNALSDYVAPTQEILDADFTDFKFQIEDTVVTSIGLPSFTSSLIASNILACFS